MQDVQLMNRSYWPDGGFNSSYYLARFPDRERQLSMARVAVRNRIQFWHPWDMEQTHTPRKVSFPIKWGDRPNGDLEWPHSLARLPFMLDLGYAYARTGDVRFLKQWRRFFLDYLKAKNREEPFWCNPLDTAIRSIRVVQGFDFIAKTGSVDRSLEKLVTDDLNESLGFLTSRLGQSVGNWEFIICTSILLMSGYLNSSRCDQFGKLAWSRLLECLHKEVNSDDIEIEVAPMYQGVIILYLFDLMIGMIHWGWDEVASIGTSVAAMLAALNRIADPSGSIPTLNDSDRFEIEYLVNIWRCLGGHHVADSATPRPRIDLLKVTNLAIINSVWGCEGSQLILDAAPLPPSRRTWHSHQDCLQITLWLDGCPVLVDPGRFTYTEHFHAQLPVLGKAIYPQGRARFLYKFFPSETQDLVRRNWRQYFRSRSTHNVLYTIDESGLQHPVESRVVGPVLHVGGPGLEAIGSHVVDASRYRCDRIVVEILDMLILVFDRASSPEPVIWYGNYHFAENLVLTEMEDGGMARTRKGIEVAAFRIIHCAHTPPETHISYGHASTVYNRKYRTPILRFCSEQTQEWVVATAITRPGCAVDFEKFAVSGRDLHCHLQLDGRAIRLQIPRFNEWQGEIHLKSNSP